MQPEVSTKPVTGPDATEHTTVRRRTHFATALALGGGVLAGYALSYAGFGFFPMWLFFTLLCPAVVCVVAATHHVRIALLSAAAMMGFLLIRVFAPGDGAFAWQLRPDQQLKLFLFTLVLAAVSLAIAGGIGAMFARKQRLR
jgi:hypothetical protein